MTTENKRLNYFGAKAIKAEPMNLGDYNNFRGWTIHENENPDREGYLVEYPDGYISWSLKEVFEEAYAWVPENETNAHAAIKIAMREVEKLGIGQNISNAAASLNKALVQINKNSEPVNTERILDAPAKYNLSEIFEELKFGRPAESQEFLEKCIQVLVSGEMLNHVPLEKNDQEQASNIPPHEQRMIDEYQQLTDKLVKGNEFTQKDFSSFSFVKFKLNEKESAFGIVVNHNRQEEKLGVNVFTGETNPNKSPVKYLEVPLSEVTHFAAFELAQI